MQSLLPWMILLVLILLGGLFWLQLHILQQLEQLAAGLNHLLSRKGNSSQAEVADKTEVVSEAHIEMVQTPQSRSDEEVSVPDEAISEKTAPENTEEFSKELPVHEGKLNRLKELAAENEKEEGPPDNEKTEIVIDPSWKTSRS